MCSPASRALPNSRRPVAAFGRKVSPWEETVAWPLRSAMAGRPEAACRFARTLCLMTAFSIRWSCPNSTTRHVSMLSPICCGKVRRPFAVNLVTARSAWIEYESENDLNVNLDGEPMLVKQFRVECRQRVLPVHLGDSPLISSH